MSSFSPISGTSISNIFGMSFEGVGLSSELNFSGYSGVFKGGVNLVGDAGTLTFTGQVGKIFAGFVGVGESGTVTFLGQNGTLKAGFTSSGTSGTMTFSGSSGSISAGFSGEGQSSDLNFTGQTGSKKLGFAGVGESGGLLLTGFPGITDIQITITAIPSIFTTALSINPSYQLNKRLYRNLLREASFDMSPDHSISINAMPVYTKSIQKSPSYSIRLIPKVFTYSLSLKRTNSWTSKMRLSLTYNLEI